VDVGFDQARVDARVKEIREAAIATSVALGAFVSEPATIPPDVQYVALSSDLALLRDAAAKAISDASR
jgi:hypothetical protein